MGDERPKVEALVAAWKAARAEYSPVFFERVRWDPDLVNRPETIAYFGAVDRLIATLLVTGPVVIGDQRYEVETGPDGFHGLRAGPVREPDNP